MFVSGFSVRGQRIIDIVTGESIAMEYGLVFRPETK